jgi:hypothetical protein
MEPDRFDDVELQVIEQPVQRGPRRATRWALAVIAGVLSAATLAAGASALTSSAGPPTSPAAQQLLNDVASDAAWAGLRPCPEQNLTVAPVSSVQD